MAQYPGVFRLVGVDRRDHSVRERRVAEGLGGIALSPAGRGCLDCDRHRADQGATLIIMGHGVAGSGTEAWARLTREGQLRTTSGGDVEAFALSGGGER